MPRRCVLGCPPSTEIPVHRFPNPYKSPDIFRRWVEIVGGRLESPEDYTFYWKKKLICDRHFTDADRNRNKRLNALAVPSLCLQSTSQHAAISSASVLLHPERPEPMDVSEPSTSASILLGTSSEQPAALMASTTLHAARPHSMDDPSALVHSLPEIPEQVNISSVSSMFDSTTTSRLEPIDKGEPPTSACIIQDASFVLSEHNYARVASHKKRHKSTNFYAARNVPVFKIQEHKRQQQQIKNLRSRMRRMRQQVQDFKARLANAEKMNDDAAFKRVSRNMSTSAKVFTQMQFRQNKKKPSGRRFSLEEKILSLSLYKRGRRCYTLLAKSFALPSAKTLKALLAQIKLGSGLIDIIFEKIKETIQHIEPEDKLYTLIFDEMSLSPQIHYDSKKDKLCGFSDFTHQKIANNVLVFMIKGIKVNVKQPVAYYFTNSLKKLELKKILVDIIKKLQAVGLNVVCTVCDQGSANVGAINELVEEAKADYLRRGKSWQHDIFKINNEVIIPLYDVPHLLKGLRNNLLTKDLLYIDEDGVEKIVKWDFFRQVCEADKNLGELSLLHKITEEHLDPEKIKKMRVAPAAQIFSHSVAVVTEHLAERGLINIECRQIVPFVIMINNLFDSLNSSTLHIPNGKIYKGCVRKNSPHHILWQKALKMFNTMRFLQKKKIANKLQIVEFIAPPIKIFIKTIKGVQALWTILSKKYNLDCLMTRHLNQDPLENFFGNIRSYGARNTAPNSVSFEGAYKALLLNNFNSPHSMQANCEKDNNDILQNLNFFFKKAHTENVESEKEVQAEEYIITEEMLLPQPEMDTGVRNYVSGWVLKKCLKNVVKGCTNCKEKLISKEENEHHNFIKLKEYKKTKDGLFTLQTIVKKHLKRYKI